MKAKTGITKSRVLSKGSVTAKTGAVIRKNTQAKFSPAWVVLHSQDTPEYKLQIIKHIRNGVSKNEWKLLIQLIGATEKELENVLPASISSMQKKTVYSKETSERIYELARLYAVGLDVFDSRDAFKAWLMTPVRTLGNKKPFDLLDSSLGFEMVENEIERIRYNVYS